MKNVNSSYINEMRSKRYLIFMLLLIVLVVYFLFQLSLWSDSDQYEYDLQNLTSKAGELDYVPLNLMSKNQPLILLWTQFYQNKLSDRLQYSPDQCPYKCQITTDRLLSDQADVRVFHIRDFFYFNRPKSNEKALNVFFIQEPPTLTRFWMEVYGLNTAPASYFNLSITYRSNADIYQPYDTFLELTGSESKKQKWSEEQVNKAIARKKKPLLAAISNCDYENGRLVYLRELRKYIDLTFVGKCNDSPCDYECLQKKIAEHHFFLAFENSVCPEYVSEKFWRIKKLIVPVVLSRGVMPKTIPNDSYVAASDFESPKELAKYLMKMVEDKEQYKGFFNWTKKYKRSQVQESEFMSLCQLCKLTHANQQFVIKNYKREWSTKECVEDYAGRLIRNDPTLREDEWKMSELVRRTGKKRSVGRVV